MLSKQEAAERVRAAKVRKNLTWARIAEAVGAPVAWMAKVPHPEGDRVVVTLDGKFLPYQW